MENTLFTQNISISNISKAKGHSYFDEKNREFIDLESGIWCASLGHSHPKVVAAIQDQAQKLIHLETKLAASFIDKVSLKLLAKAKMTGKVFFMNTGSEAIDFALTVAKLANKRSEITTFTENYLGAYGKVNQIENRIDINKCLRCKEPKQCANCKNIKNKLNRGAILIFDPFCFMRQVIEIPSKLIIYLKEEIKRQNITLILDEITTGLGRTGKWFGFQYYGLQPDLVVVGKTLGNGYPVSAVLMNGKSAALIKKKGLSYAQSHQNDPLACKVAETVIDTLENEQLVEKSDKTGKLILQCLEKEFSDIDAIKAVRGKGMMFALVVDSAICVENVYRKLLSKGFVIGYSKKYNVLNFFPAFNFPEKLIPKVVNQIKETIHEEMEPKYEIYRYLSLKY